MTNLPKIIDKICESLKKSYKSDWKLTESEDLKIYTHQKLELNIQIMPDRDTIYYKDKTIPLLGPYKKQVRDALDTRDMLVELDEML
jgi:hypothetical protein